MKQYTKRALSFLVAAALFMGYTVGLGGFWGPVDAYSANETAEITELEALGDWLHYNGIAFGDLHAYQADLEGALAVGGAVANWGVREGFDAGASFHYYDTVQMGDYTNPESYPTVLLGVDTLNIGHKSRIYGGSVVMRPEVMAAYDGMAPGFELNEAWLATASGELIDRWFDHQYRFISGAMQQYLGANEVSIAYSEFSSGDYFRQRNPEAFRNTELTLDGQVDETVLSITVRSGEMLNSMMLPIHAGWPQQYELIVFTFPDAVSVSMGGAPQTLYNSVQLAPHWPDGVLRQQYANAEAMIAERDALCANVVYSFPNARSISITSAQLFGSILAPNANVSLQGGQINGQLVCNDYTTQGGGELHARRINRKIFDLVEEPEDEQGTGAVRLTKHLHYRVDSAVTLPGAVYQLQFYDADLRAWGQYDNGALHTTGADGSLVIEDLPWGRYRLVELEAPPGFDLAAAGSTGSLEFEITADHAEAALELAAWNEPLYTALDFRKTGVDGVALDGARFELVRLPDEYDFSAEQGIRFAATSAGGGGFGFSGLPMGSYVLKELDAPEGYELMDDIAFDIVYDAIGGELTAMLPGSGEPLHTLLGDPLTLQNAAGRDNALSVFKYNGAAPASDDARGLAGARFELWRLVGGGWERWEPGGSPLAVETDAAGYARVDGLPDGTYRLVETKAPDGFVAGNRLADDSGDFAPVNYTAEVELGLVDAVQLVEVPNTPLYTGLALRKYGELDGVRAPLAGARFELWQIGEGEAADTLVSRAATPESGELSYAGLTEGRYRLVETAAPEGYRLPDGEILIEVRFDERGEPTITVDAGALDDLARYEAGKHTLELTNLPHTGSLTVYKMDRERFQNGTDWDDDKSYHITYLAGAELRLQRRQHGLSGDYVDFGERFTTSLDGYGQDAWGNARAGATIDGLPWGEYRIVELKAPDGYVCDAVDGVVGWFTITEAMAAAAVAVEYDVTNVRDNARGPIRIRKVDRETPGLGLAGVEFKLWRIDDSLHPLTGREQVDEVMPNLMQYGQQKYAYETPLLTDTDGWLTLELEPGLYLLFEYEPADGYLYTLERGQTLERATDPSFYHYSYLFRVVEMPDPADGVRIRWVDRYKLLDGEVICFDPDRNDMDNGAWSAQDLDEAQYTSFTVTNRRADALTASVALAKLDEEKKALAGATFTLARAALRDEKDLPYPDSDFDDLETAVSGPDGAVRFDGLAEGRYRLTETAAPSGYAPIEQPVYFSLVVDGYAKVLDFYDEQGTRTAGYTEPTIDKVSGGASGSPVYLTHFPLGERQNFPATIPTGSLALRKVDADKPDTGLPGAIFALLAWDDEADGWTGLRDGLTTGAGGLLIVSDLPAGDYKLVETAPPPGYEDESLEIAFSMVAEGDGEAARVVPARGDHEWDADGQLLAKNTAVEEPAEATGELTLRKVDTDDGRGLSGAVFALDARDDGADGWTQLRAGLTTGTDGLLTISDLPAGRYRLRETSPPVGYADAGLELFFVMEPDKEDNSVLPAANDTGWDAQGRLLAYNTADKTEPPDPGDPEGAITVHKVDAETGEGLPGAVFSLYQTDGDVETELRAGLTTGAGGLLVVGDLAAGEYRLTETSPPDGYRDDPVSALFTMERRGDLILPVQDDISWENGRLTVANTLEEEPDDPRGEIVVEKVDADDGRPLAGAVFDLYVAGGLLRGGLTTDADGRLVIAGLAPGDYELREVRAPAGYRPGVQPTGFAMVLDNDAVVPGFADGAADDADYLLYRWESEGVGEEEEKDEEQTPPGEEEEPGGDDGEFDDPGDDDSEDADAEAPDEDGEDRDEDSDDEDDADAGDGEEPSPDDGKESDTDDTGTEEPGEPLLRSILDFAVPLTDTARPTEGEWVLVSLHSYRADRDGVITLTGLVAGSYKLACADPAGDLPERFFALEADSERYELALGAGGEALLRIENRRQPTKPDPEEPGKPGGSGGGGGNGGEYREGGNMPEPDPPTPAEPEPGDKGSVGGGAAGTGGPNNNADTGMLEPGALLGWGLSMAGAGGALANRKAIRWWLHGLPFKRR